MKSSAKYLSALAAVTALGIAVASALPSFAHGNLIRETVRVVAPSYPPSNADNGVNIYTPTGSATVFTAPYSVATASTHSVIVAAVAGKKIRILGVTMSNVSTGTATFETSTSNTQLNTFQLAATSQTNLASDKFGYGDTNAGDALQLTVTGTTNTVAGNIRYAYY